jgi:hypothetical protein
VVGVGEPQRGDVVLRPAFLSVLRELTGPCDRRDLRPVPALELSWLSAGSGGEMRAPAGRTNAAVQRALLALAALALAAEWGLRRRRTPGVLLGGRSSGQQRAA